MQIITLNDVETHPRRVAVGEFDGVHLGHRAVIAGNATVLTFEPHPAAIVRPDHAPKLLTSLALKAEVMAGIGVRELVVIQFDQQFAQKEPDTFVDAVLIGKLGATHVSVGANFHFGHCARGNAELLAADRRFQTTVVPLVSVEGRRVSSTRIRALVGDGKVELAAALLGAPFRIRERVVDGDRRGRQLGFPTANLRPDPRFVYPAHGVYAGRANGLPAAVSVGVRPTFGKGLEPLVEVFLLDFDGDLYGQELTVEFVANLRAEERFADAEALVAQMRLDVSRTRELLGSGGG